MSDIIINGKNYTVDDNKSLLQIIREENIDVIPTLCSSSLIEPFTSCFLCVVEVETMEALKPACSTKPVPGMKISTRSEKVLNSRKANLELLLSNHRADCHPPCRLACPANVDIQGYIALASRGLYREAVRLMRETNPLPMVCGRVCAKPCEDKCRRNYVDEPVDIKNIKRFVADFSLEDMASFNPVPAPSSGKRAAVIGSGPAGLSAAYFLRLKGHAVTIFESMPQAGGMLRYGIPEYRLPKADLQKEIDAILKLGIDIKFNTWWGKDITAESLFKEGFGAVFIGIGAQGGSGMGIPGSSLKGLMQGVDFLREVGLGKAPRLHGKVFIVGGGNTAIDAARTALRSGAGSVGIIYRRTEEDMPASIEEIEDARDENISLMTLTNPLEYCGNEEGKLEKIRLIKMKQGEPDASGRRSPVPLEGSEYFEKADFVIEAIGQKVNNEGGVPLTKRGTIEISPGKSATSMKGFFAAGDAVTGPDIIIAAVAGGRKAACEMDLYLREKEIYSEDILGFHVRKEDYSPVTEEEFAQIKKIPRNRIIKEKPALRVSSFIEVEKGLTEESLLNETSRCMECGCQDLHECRLRAYSAEYGADNKKYPGGEFRADTYKSGHPFLRIELDKCVNCGLCVNLCEQFWKQSVYSFNGRGFGVRPLPASALPLGSANCVSCGTCAANCPVGAITEYLPAGKPGPFVTEKTESFCVLCGSACPLLLETRGSTLFKISSSGRSELCRIGRFSYPSFISGPGNIDYGEIRKKIAKAANSKVLIALSPSLPVEDIDFLIAYSHTKGTGIFSPQISALAGKDAILKENSLYVRSSLNFQDYENIAVLDDLSKEKNSVLIRRIISSGRKIILTKSPEKIYFNYSLEQSLPGLMNLYSRGRTLLILNPGYPELKELAIIASALNSLKSINYMIIRDYINHDYLRDKLAVINMVETPAGRNYETLIAVNTDADGNFREKILLSEDASVPHSVPVLSSFEKTGTFIDQAGCKKTTAAKSDCGRAQLRSLFG